MARRQSYFAKSNRGKAGQVFFNNMVASSEQYARDKKKQAAQEAREEKKQLRELAKHEREVAAEERRQQREKEKQEKLNQKAAKVREKEQAKNDKYLARINLICGKFEIDNLCADEIFEEALAADVPLGKISSLVVEPKVDYWTKRSEDIREEEQLRVARIERIQYVESVKDYCDVVIEQRNILGRFRDALYEEMIASNTNLEEIQYHQSVNKYAQESKDIVNILDQKLDYFCLAS